MKYLIARSRNLSGTSLYMWWFPPEIQIIIEILFKNKPVEEDVPGLLSMIMFAGIGFSYDEEVHFKKQVIETLYLLSDTTNNFYESQHNLSELLFGITVDDVSSISSMQTLFHF
jgi:hypothetical protein